MRIDEFEKWCKDSHLTMAGIGLELGISEEIVMDYLSGKMPIPRTIAILCYYIDVCPTRPGPGEIGYNPEYWDSISKIMLTKHPHPLNDR